MTDNQPDSVQPEETPASPLEPAPTPAAAPAKKSRRNLVIIIGALAAGICLISVLCVAILGTGIFKAISERGEVQSVVDEFMQAMVVRDTGGAYELFSARARRQTPLSEVEAMLEGNNYFLFDGFQSVSVENININVAFNSDPDVPQGTVAEVSGNIAYDGGYTGRFEAVLEQETDAWRLHSIHVTVPPEKINP